MEFIIFSLMLLGIEQNVKHDVWETKHNGCTVWAHIYSIICKFLSIMCVSVPSISMLYVAHYCLSPFHPNVAELVELKRLYQGKVPEMSKLKQGPEESQTSLDKVCSLLAVLF